MPAAPMTPENKLEIVRWVVSQGLEGTPEIQLLPALCARLADAGISLLRANIYQPTLHPMIGGHIFVWWKGARGSHPGILESGTDRSPP